MNRLAIVAALVTVSATGLAGCTSETTPPEPDQDEVAEIQAALARDGGLGTGDESPDFADPDVSGLADFEERFADPAGALPAPPAAARTFRLMLVLDAVDVLMQLGRKDEAKQLLAGDYANEPDRANALRARLALLDGAADTAPLEARLAANADDHAARLELAKAYAAQSRFREALEAALEVVRRDRFFDEGAGRKAILALFEALSGEQYDDLVREFRRKLSAALN